MQGNNNYFVLSRKSGEFCNLFYTPVCISDKEVNKYKNRARSTDKM